MSAPELSAEPYLTEPLRGTRLIEASAGTGKTFTLATLFTRLVVEDGLRMGQVLAVTYTEAATQELRKRIRERLALAAALVGTSAPAGEGHEAALTRAVIDAHLARAEVRETPAQLAARLRAAAEDTDLAAIFTIHGFCARVLREHALEAGQGFAADGLLADADALHAEVAADLWRVHARAPRTAAALAALWPSPEALAADLPVLCGPLPLLPAPDGAPDAPAAAGGSADGTATAAAAREAAAERLRAALAAHLAEAQAAVAAAFDGKLFDGRRARRASFDKAFEELQAGAPAGEWPRDDKTHVQKLLPEALAGFCRDGRQDDAPASPVFAALRDWCLADAVVQAAQRGEQVRLLHRLRGEGRARLAALKRMRRVQTYDDLIERVAAALDGPQGARLAERLRAQYRVALVDEFQDTDARQWAIFDTVFGTRADPADAGAAHAAAPSGDPAAAPARFLALIGDPKQAIYGFRGGDVATYLAAKRVACQAPPLARNFRSRPALLRAVEALYAGAAAKGLDAFAQPGIAFEHVEPGTQRHDADHLRAGLPAPALTLHLLPAGEDGRPLKADEARAAATAACVADIHRVLSEARAGRALLDGRPVKPGDIAVLVRNHKEATRVQQALAAAGVPAVAAGKLSLFATNEAADLRALLLALNQPADAGRLRAALATVLLGFDAAAIAALDGTGDALRPHQNRLLGWRERLQRGGPLALVNEICAAQAERLLGLLDGERRLTNYLQLGELLQEAAARALGLHGLIDWLDASIARAGDGDEAQLLRLESDAHRVQIVTLHKSKGLEYPLVYLPFAGIGTRRPDAGRCRIVHDRDGRRVVHWAIDRNGADWAAAAEAARLEAQAEDARLLYVGLTRAEHALWIAAGALPGFGDTRLAPLLADMDALRAHADVRIVEGFAADRLPRLAPESAERIAPARVAARRIAPDWWVYSFTQLTHAEGGGDPMAASTEADAGGEDEAPAVDPAASDAAAVPDAAPGLRFAGPRFGVVMHAALEAADFAAWRNWRAGDPAPDGQDAVIAEALAQSGYAESDIAAGVAALVPLVGHTLTVALPEGVRLAALPEDERRNEMEFHFALRPTPVQALLALLHRHGLLRGRRGFGARQRLEGLMTGKIDLTYRFEGRWYVLDYKSNRLPAYDAAAMDAAMEHSEYGLQALLYTLALHRWLRFRLGDAYDYARDFGGVRYLFCRGLDAANAASPGVHAWRFEPALIAAVDALFAGQADAEEAVA